MNKLTHEELVQRAYNTLTEEQKDYIIIQYLRDESEEDLRERL